MTDKVTAGRFSIDRADFTTLVDTTDISFLIGEIRVNESIYQYFPVYEITVVDGVNLFENKKLSGNEFLDLRVSVLNEDNEPRHTVTKKLRVIGYDGYFRTSRVQGYILQCMEVPTYNAMVKRVSKSMTGSMSDILEDLLFEIGYLNVEVTGQRSVGNHCIVFPNITYNEAIEMVIRKMNIPDFSTVHLFDTLWRGSFVSTYKSMVDKDSAFDYIMSYQTDGGANTLEYFDDEERSIKNLSSNLNLSNIDVSHTGGNSSMFHEIDQSKKFYEIINFNIIDDGPELPRVIKKSKHLFDEKYGLAGLEAFSFQRATNTMAYSDRGETYNTSEFTPNFLAKKAAVLQNQFGIKHRITVAGNEKVCLGDIITLDLPRAQDPSTSDPGTDEWLSGRYLVTEIAHKMHSGYKYVMEVSCQRDSRND